MYEGEVKNGVYDGLGKLTCDNGDVIHGVWEAGNFRRGKMFLADKTIMIGVWENGSLKRGKIIYPCGVVMYGDWENGKLKHGTKTNPGFYLLEGDWEDDKLKKGKAIWKDETYEGRWENCKFVEGKKTCSNGTELCGVWLNGRLHKGKATYKSGTCKEGEWCDGKLIEGTIHYPNGDIATIKDGITSIKYHSGCEFVGTVVRGKAHGYGEFRYTHKYGYSDHVKSGDFKNGSLISTTTEISGKKIKKTKTKTSFNERYF